MKKKLFAALAVVGISLPLVAFSGCDNKPVNKLINPAGSDTTNQWQASGFNIFDDEIKTGGTIMGYTSTEGQEINFSCHTNPHSGSTCLKFSWDGSEVTWYKDDGTTVRENLWAGLGLIVANDVTRFNTTTPKDFTGAGYNKIKFWARKEFMSDNTALSVKGPVGPGGTQDFMQLTNSGLRNNIDPMHGAQFALPITTEWQEYSLPLSPANVSAVKEYFVIALEAPNGNGNGTVYVDDIRMVRE